MASRRAIRDRVTCHRAPIYRATRGRVQCHSPLHRAATLGRDYRGRATPGKANTCRDTYRPTYRATYKATRRRVPLGRASTRRVTR